MIIKGDNGDLRINVIKRSDATTDDFWDANWLEANIEIEIPGFRVSYGMNLRIDDL